MCLDVPADGWHAGRDQEESEDEYEGGRLGGDVTQHAESKDVTEEPLDPAIFF